MDLPGSDVESDGINACFENVPRATAPKNTVDLDTAIIYSGISKRRDFHPAPRMKRVQQKQVVQPRSKSGKGGKLTQLALDESDEVELTKEDIKSIYAELQAISDKLREENHILHEREAKLKERERMLAISQESLQTVADHHVKVKMAALEERLKSELSQMDQALKEKTKENKRLKENFETIKQANDVMKKEIEVLQAQNGKLSKNSSSLHARLANLQRKQEYEQKLKDSEVLKQQADSSSSSQQTHSEAVGATATSSKQGGEKQEEKALKSTKQSKHASVQVYSSALATLLDWVCEAHLRQALTDLPTHPSDTYCAPDFIQERVFKVLPCLVDILRDNASNIKCCLPCLQFIYWSLLHIDQIQTQQNVCMSTTMRRLGEEIYYPKSAKVTEVEKIIGTPTVLNDKLKDALFLRSSNSHVRLLSALIVLKTLSRSDVLAQAFDVLKTELKEDQAKELFLYYQASNVITFYLKPVNKTFISVAVDVMLQMASDSPFQRTFLESCGNEHFFRAAALLIRTPLSDIRVMERLSIVLQKLSKIRTNKRYFEIYTIVAIIQEMLVAGGNENAFLTLNLKSILFNLNVAAKS
ncbi:coiled-coil domain-containing protein 138 [Elysia marginata]|uniref:Coiled-coil domain-containing protein 138 n=1 Tax=Elysia marginata TaxID=1093978 RepID=A0AAV4F804_9GAST|nr:coiled-coil domain-containing protein 138 [Elysia marginata]